MKRCTTFLILAVALGAAACKRNMAVAPGAEVKIHYTLTVDGKTVDTSRNAEPLAFVVGTQSIIPGLEEQLMGLHAGDKKTVVVPPEKAYGPIRQEAIQKVPRKNFTDMKDIKPGMTVMARGQGNVIQAKVVEVGKDTVSLDMNHPLAGKTLNFDVEVVSVGKAGKQDAAGPPAPQAPQGS